MTLRTSKPFPGERRDAVSIPADKAVGTTAKATCSSTDSYEKTDARNAQGENEDLEQIEGGNTADTSDDDSTGRVGEEEAADLDRNLDGNDEDSIDSLDELDEKTANVTAMMQRILNLASSSGGKGVVPLVSEKTNQIAGGKPIITPHVLRSPD